MLVSSVGLVAFQFGIISPFPDKPISAMSAALTTAAERGVVTPSKGKNGARKMAGRKQKHDKR